MATTNIFNMADTWTAAGTTYTAILMNVTDTASAAGSLLMNLQVGGSSMFTVSKAGRAIAAEQVRGVGIYSVSGGGMGVLSNTGSLTFGISEDVILTRGGAANILSLVNGNNNQTMRFGGANGAYSQ